MKLVKHIFLFQYPATGLGTKEQISIEFDDRSRVASEYLSTHLGADPKSVAHALRQLAWKVEHVEELAKK